ncbi:MAG: Tn3 family transposase [Haloechinothrix sp.]
MARNLFACLIAQACNIGLTAMADASGISYDTLAWTAEWYLREDTLRTANAAVVNYHHRLAMSRVWGAATLSSSDGQRFPTKGRSISARALSRYFVDEGISTYTHVSDQHSTYGTQVIVATQSEATYVLDEILGNATDLPISEHVTDTGGVTLVNFALFDLVGLQFSPRIRDLGKVTLYRIGSRRDVCARWPHAGPLLAAKANIGLIAEHWDDLLRVAASLKYGRATASLVVGKLCASTRQSAFAAALKKCGALLRTIHAARYLADEDRRRRIGRQPNKGEGLHSLRRGLFFAREGHVRHREPEQQTDQALCLTLVTNLIVAWNTEYLDRAAAAVRATGETIDDEILAHIAPALTDHVRFHGTYAFDVDRELAELGPAGYRPLRHPNPERDNHVLR